MPYTLTKQEKEAFRREYQNNVRIMNQYLPEGKKIKMDLKALNKRLNDPREQRFYKKSLEILARENKKIDESARLRAIYEPKMRVKNRPDPFDRLMHCELAPGDSEEQRRYNEIKIKNYYRHPEAEIQRRVQNLINLDLSPLSKAMKSNDPDNFLLDFYEKNNTAIEDSFCVVRTVGTMPKDALTPEMKQYGEAVGVNYEMLVSVNAKLSKVKEGSYFTIPSVTEEQMEILNTDADFPIDHPELFEKYKEHALGEKFVIDSMKEFKELFTSAEKAGIDTKGPFLKNVVAQDKTNGKIMPYTAIERIKKQNEEKRKRSNNIGENNIDEKPVPDVKRLNEQEINGINKLFTKDYTKEKGYLALELPREFQKPGPVRAREELIYNFALDNNKKLAELDVKGLGSLAESFPGGIKEQLFHTTSREYKEFTRAMKNFDNPNKRGEYQNSGRVVDTANNYLIHRGVKTMEQALALPEPQRSRCVLCLNSINTFQKHADPQAEKVVPGTTQTFVESPKKNDWPAAIEDESLVNDNVIQVEEEIEKAPVKEKANIIEEEINTIENN